MSKEPVECKKCKPDTVRVAPDGKGVYIKTLKCSKCGKIHKETTIPKTS